MSNKEKRILERVDEVCARMHTTRAEVLYALLRGIVAESLPGASTHAFEQKAPEGNTRAARPEAAIQHRMERVLKTRGTLCRTLLYKFTNGRRDGTVAWDKALSGLFAAHRIGVTEDKKHYFWAKEDPAA